MSRSPDINAEDSEKEPPVRRSPKEVNGQSNYSDQYSDPRWRERSREFIRTNPTCSCGSTANLRVHHINYESGKALWDYDDHEMQTLCVDCHDQMHSCIRLFRFMMSQYKIEDMNAILLALVDLLECHQSRVVANKVRGIELVFRPTGSVHES